MHDYRKNFEVMLIDGRYQIVRKNSSGWNTALLIHSVVLGAIVVLIALYY